MRGKNDEKAPPKIGTVPILIMHEKQNIIAGATINVPEWRMRTRVVRILSSTFLHLNHYIITYMPNIIGRIIYAITLYRRNIVANLYILYCT